MQAGYDINEIDYTGMVEAFSSEPDHRMYLLKDVVIYSDTRLTQVKCTEKANTLVPFLREVHRHGKHLFKLQYGELDFGYIERDDLLMIVCEQAKVHAYNELDFVMISFAQFDHYKLNVGVGPKLIESGREDQFSSKIIQEPGIIIYKLKDTFKNDDSQLVASLYSLSIDAQAGDIKLGRLLSGSKFYILPSTGLTPHPRKLITITGVEGIFSGQKKAYHEVASIAELGVSAIAILLGFALFGIIFFIISDVTGGIFELSALTLPIILFVSFLVTAPLYYLIRFIGRRI